MDREEGTQKESFWEKLGLAAFGFVVFGVPILALLHWLVDPPSWVLIAVSVALALVAAFIGFSEEMEEDESRWVYRRPVGIKAWLARIGMTYLAWAGLALIVNKLLLTYIIHASATVKALMLIPLLLLAIWAEFFELEEKSDSASDSRAEHSDERPGLVDA